MDDFFFWCLKYFELELKCFVKVVLFIRKMVYNKCVLIFLCVEYRFNVIEIGFRNNI